MADDGNDRGPVGKGQRFLRLAGMTAAVAGRYASARLKGVFEDKAQRERSQAEAHHEIGARIARTLGELKGAAMKIGQMASVGADILPKELAEALAVLQNSAPPVSYEVIAEVIEAELGAPPERLFAHFETQPFASASIGQVHRARVDDGREVVVKVQYPKVDQSVGADLAHLKMALRAGGLLRLDRQATNALFAEIKARLDEELDYTNEAENVRIFRDFHAKDPDLHLPEVVGERSAKRVLTLTYVPGDSLQEVQRQGYSQEARDRIGHTLYRMVLDQVFDLRAVHADPNPANFAFRPDGSVVLYDFGCDKTLSEATVEHIRAVLRTALVEDYEGLDRAMLAIGGRNPKAPPVEASFYKTFRDIILHPHLHARPFDYGQARIHEDIIKEIPLALRKMHSFQPPVEIVFVHRVAVGHYGNLRTIGPRTDFLPAILEVLDLRLEDIPA